VISSLLKIVSILCCLVLLISFGAFVSDEAGHSSKQTVAKIETADASENVGAPAPVVNQASPSPRTERMREKEHGAMREHIDDANDILVSPFKSIVSSQSLWAQRIVSALLAFLVFGVGLGFLGRYASQRGV
jgi:hypothetical protein